MPLFTTLTTERMCSEIDDARKHVILAAPGVGTPVAEALQRANDRLGQGAVQVVLDISARVARLGYGNHAAVESLHQAGIAVRHHPGLRIGALICDDAGWSFAASPSLVEADPSEDSEAFNSIALTSAQVMMLRAELPPLSRADSNVPTPEYSVVGTEPVDNAALGKVKQALAIAPPQQFDLARQTQVYAALIQFVDLTFEGFNIQSKSIQLPKTLPLIASKDKALKERVTTSLKVLGKIDKPKALTHITDQLEELRHAYLVPVGQMGRIMLKSKRLDFERELGEIQVELDACKESLAKELDKALKDVIEAVVPDLTRAVMTDPPPRFRGLFPAKGNTWKACLTSPAAPAHCCSMSGTVWGRMASAGSSGKRKTLRPTIWRA